MNQLNKNRLIGGGVLAFAALLFAPSILTPEKHDLTNPTLVVNIDDNATDRPSQASIASENATTNSVTPSVSAQPAVKLESLNAETRVASSANASANATSSASANSKPSAPTSNSTNNVKPVPVALGSTAGNTVSPVSSAKPSATATHNTPTKSSWLRVGSFSSQKNADNLLKKLKAKYPVKVETITVDGKTYHRVLVGPYNSENTLQTAKKSLNASGYQPGIQR